MKSHCYSAFRQIRVNNKKQIKPLDPKISHLVDQRNELLKNYDEEETSKKLENLEKTISSIEEKDFIVKKFKQFGENPEAVNLNEV